MHNQPPAAPPPLQGSQQPASRPVNPVQPLAKYLNIPEDRQDILLNRNWLAVLEECACFYEIGSPGRNPQRFKMQPLDWQGELSSRLNPRTHLALPVGMAPAEWVGSSILNLQLAYGSRKRNGSFIIGQGRELWLYPCTILDPEDPTHSHRVQVDRDRNLLDEDLDYIIEVYQAHSGEVYPRDEPGEEPWDYMSCGECPSSSAGRRRRCRSARRVQQGLVRPTAQAWWPPQLILILAMEQLQLHMDLAALAPFLATRHLQRERRTQLQAIQTMLVFSFSQEEVHIGMLAFKTYMAAQLDFQFPEVASQAHFQVTQRKELLRRQAEEQQ